MADNIKVAFTMLKESKLLANMYINNYVDDEINLRWGTNHLKESQPRSIVRRRLWKKRVFSLCSVKTQMNAQSTTQEKEIVMQISWPKIAVSVTECFNLWSCPLSLSLQNLHTNCTSICIVKKLIIDLNAGN